jgi:hypothetical protein
VIDRSGLMDINTHQCGKILTVCRKDCNQLLIREIGFCFRQNGCEDVLLT